MKKRVLGIQSHIKLHKYLRVTGISASILLALFAVLTLNPVSHHEEEAEATANPSTSRLEILSDSNVAGVKLNVNSTNGTFAKTNSADEMKFSVITDNLTGYTLSLSATDDSGKLMNETINAAALDSITTALSYSDFANGSSASAYNGMWGVEPSKYNSADNTDYLPAPTTEPMILDTTNKANTTANEYTVGIGARADFNTPSGIYSNTFILQVVGRPVMYAINYLDTTEDDTVVDLPEADSSSTATAVDFSLDDGSPTRDGYTFIGWCDGTVDHTNSPSTCDGDTYMPGAKYTFEDSDEETVHIANFYAMWKETSYTITFRTVNAESIEFEGVTYMDGQSVVVKPSTYSNMTREYGVFSLVGNYASRYTFQSWDATTGTISNQDYVDYNLNTFTPTDDATITLTGQYVETPLQGLSPDMCAETPIPTYDTRDDQVYWVKRLADGNCWMMDNLNLGAVALTEDLTSANTNIDDSIVSTTFRSWKKIGSSETITDPEYIPINKGNAANSMLARVGGVNNITGTKFGTIYNYCAATAGTNCTQYTTKSPTSDICPAGWRMPTGGSGGDWANLYTAIRGDGSINEAISAMRAPVSVEGSPAIGLSGYITYGSSPLGHNSSGRYWSSTVYVAQSSPNSTYAAYTFYIDTMTIHQMGTEQKSVQATMRCVRDTSDITTATYMQDITPLMKYNTTAGTVANLKDRRDDEEYKVSKLADNRIWMIDNIRLDPTAVSLADLQGNTNASDTTLGYLKNGGGTGQYPTSGVSSTWADDRSLPFVAVDHKDTVSSVTYGSGSGKLGVYYNACAASAGSYCYTTGNWTANISEDLCPANWRLPTGTDGSGSELQALYSAYNSDLTAFYDAFSMTLSGNFRSGSGTGPVTPTQEGTYGRFWSSNGTGWGGVYDTYATSSSFSVQSASDGYWGESIRCIAK